jgi:hypothetical protein
VSIAPQLESPGSANQLMAIFQQRLGTQLEAALVEITRRLADQTP